MNWPTEPQGAGSATRPIDQNLLSGLELALVVYPAQGDDSGLGESRGILKRHLGGLECKYLFTSARVFCKTAEGPHDVAKHIITGLEPRDPIADRFNPPRDVRSEDLEPGLEQAPGSARVERRPGQHLPIGEVQRGRMDPEKNLIVLGCGLRDLLKCNNLWRPILVTNSGFHSFDLGYRGT